MRLEERIEERLGSAVVLLRRLSGGDLSEVFDLRLADGRRLVAKHAATAGREGAMLEAIRRAGCPAPEVISADPDLLVMERLADGGRPGPRAWKAAGAAAARLHAATGPGYGWASDHAFGAVAIPNASAETWPAFWAERRLLADPGALPAEVARRLEQLARDLENRLPQRPRPALLHGDFWSGNLLFGPGGFSGLIDPASYHGEPEVDLAMLWLFGSPPPAFGDGYGGLPEGWTERRRIYQLWPALVHLRLFGSGYRAMVDDLLDSCGV